MTALFLYVSLSLFAPFHHTQSVLHIILFNWLAYVSSLSLSLALAPSLALSLSLVCCHTQCTGVDRCQCPSKDFVNELFQTSFTCGESPGKRINTDSLLSAENDCHLVRCISFWKLGTECSSHHVFCQTCKVPRILIGDYKYSVYSLHNFGSIASLKYDWQMFRSCPLPTKAAIQKHGVCTTIAVYGCCSYSWYTRNIVSGIWDARVDESSSYFSFWGMESYVMPSCRRSCHSARNTTPHPRGT